MPGTGEHAIKAELRMPKLEHRLSAALLFPRRH
jgi:hypothetical protein